jgi:hypothetical protein
MAFTQQTPIGTPDVNLITKTLAGLRPDSALQQYAMLHKNNPYIVSLAKSESDRRKALRMAAQGQVGQQPTVVDQDIAGMAQQQLPENQGIAQLPTPNVQHMADGGIAGYDDGGMAEGGGPASQLAFNNEPVMRMASGGKVPGYAAGVYNKERFKEFLKAKNIDEKAFSALDFSEKEKILKDFGDMTSGPQKTAPKPTPTAATPTAAPSKAYELGQKVGPTVAKAGETLSNIGTTKTSKLPLGGGATTAGVLGLGSGLYEGYTQGDFYNDPNVSAIDKAKQAGLTGLRAGLPVVGAGAGSFFSPVGTGVGTLLGTGAAALLPSETEALAEWKKANPQAKPEEEKKAKNEIAAAAAAAGQDAGKAVTAAPQAAPSAGTAGGVSAPPASGAGDVKSMYELFAGPKNVRDTQLNDIERQYKELAESKTSAAQRDYNQLQTDLAARGEYGKDREAKLKAREERVGKEEGQAGGLALLEAGLAMMSGTSTNALANIGQGALAGTAAYRKSQEKLADARDKLDDAYGRLEDVRFNQKSMDAKELRAAKQGIDNATNAGLESLINFTAKRFDIDRDEAGKLLGSYTNLRTAEIGAAPKWAQVKAMEGRYNQANRERTDYINLQKSVMGNLAKNTMYASATPAQQKQMEIEAMRNALKLNPHLAGYASDLGFEKSAAGPVYDLTSDRE